MEGPITALASFLELFALSTSMLPPVTSRYLHWPAMCRFEVCAGPITVVDHPPPT